MRSRRVFFLLAAVATALFMANVPEAQAELITSTTMNLGGTEYSGSGGNTLPDNALQVTFEEVAANTVKLTIDGTNLPSDTAKLSGVAFNVDPIFGEDSLTFAYDSGVQAKSITFAPDGVAGWGPAGMFDIGFTFQPGSFDPLDKSIYIITGNGLDTDSFHYTSSGDNPQLAVFHLNITGTGFESGMYGTTSVPEPTTLIMWLAFGSIGSILAWRKCRKSA
ncbi:MAG: PEP-CTERM sorting domain-containing protein [Pirellulaceae bacterium]